MTPVLRADGGADLLVEIDSIVVTVGAIEPLWATDADGGDFFQAHDHCGCGAEPIYQ